MVNEGRLQVETNVDCFGWPIAYSLTLPSWPSLTKASWPSSRNRPPEPKFTELVCAFFVTPRLPYSEWSRT